MADIPSFFNKADFWGTLLPGYFGILVYIALFQRSILSLSSTQSFDLLSAVIFIIAGPVIGLILQQSHRIVLTTYGHLRNGKDADEFRKGYDKLRLKAKTAELATLDLKESEYDFNVSSAIALTILFGAYAWSTHIQDQWAWTLVPGVALLFIGAYFAISDYEAIVLTLMNDYKLLPPAYTTAPATPTPKGQ